MSHYLARANVQVGGQLVAYGAELETEPTAEVATLVAAGLLTERLEDGTYPDPPPPEPRVRCCGQR